MQLLDSRGVGKVPTFSGRHEDFTEWIFPFESYCGLLGWTDLFEAVLKLDGPANREQLGAGVEPVGRWLYHLLASTTRGTALSIVKRVDRGNGFEAMRRLYGEYRPKINEEHGALLQQIPTPLWWLERESMHRFTDVLISWDELIARYEQATGERLTENMRTPTILADAPEDIKQTFRSASREVRSSIVSMRSCIFESVIGRSGIISRPPQSSSNSGEKDNRMEVDAASKVGGKGKPEERSSQGVRKVGTLCT